METDNLDCNEAPSWFINALDECEEEAAEPKVEIAMNGALQKKSLGFV